LFAGKSRAASREEHRRRGRNWPAALMQPARTTRHKKGEMDGEGKSQGQEEEMFLAIRWAMDNRCPRLGNVQEHGFGRPVALKTNEFNRRTTMEGERCSSMTKTMTRVVVGLEPSETQRVA